MAKHVDHNEGRSGRSKSTPRAAQAMVNNGTTGDPDWGRIEDRLIWQVIQTVTRDDGAVMFGYSRDGGAYAVQVYEGNDKTKFYGHTDQEVTDWMIRLLEVYNG